LLNLEQKLNNKTAVIGIIGLGYVGLPLVLAFSGAGFKALGFDIRQRNVDSVNCGESYIADVADDRLSAIVAKRDIRKGEKLSLDNLWFKRTEEESPVKQSQFWQLIGLEATQDIGEDEIIDFTKVKYEFKRLDTKSFTM